MEPIIELLVKKVITANSAKIYKIVGSSAQSFLRSISLNYARYLELSFNRYSRVKTLLDRDEPTLVEDIYVTTFLRHSKKRLKDDIFIQSATKNGGSIIIGTAGSGKSMFMRYVFLRLISSEMNGAPIFVELRGLNSSKAKTLILYIYEIVIGPSRARMTFEQFEAAIAEGIFILMLDGFDEIDFERRDEAERELVDLLHRHPASRIILSSRPDERFVSWTPAKTYHIEAMSKVEVLKLIKKLNYDRKLRNKFYQRVKKDLFDAHESFLSNPLLVTIMMITFEQFAEIPDRIHLFYEYAYEALFFRHDASKEAAYKRKKMTSLAMNEFRNVLSAICIFSYTDEKFEFSESEMLELIDRAADFEEIPLESPDYLHDLVESVCIFKLDGTHYTFTHRSFQEYFSALFLTRGATKSLPQILDWILDSRSADNVVEMTLSIAPALIEREWVLPRLKKLVDLSSETNVGLVYSLIGGLHVYRDSPQFFHMVFESSRPWASFYLSLSHIFNEIRSWRDVDHYTTTGRQRNTDAVKAIFPGRDFSTEGETLEFAEAKHFGDEASVVRMMGAIREDAIELYNRLIEKHSRAEANLTWFLSE